MRRPLVIFLLLSSCAAPLAWSDPGVSEELQIPQLRSSPPEPAPIERKRPPQFRLPEHTYAVIDAQGQSSAARKAGRLSIEQRRALRRQINEAGSDLYVHGE